MAFRRRFGQMLIVSRRCRKVIPLLLAVTLLVSIRRLLPDAAVSPHVFSVPPRLFSRLKDCRSQRRAEGNPAGASSGAATVDPTSGGGPASGGVWDRITSAKNAFANSSFETYDRISGTAERFSENIGNISAGVCWWGDGCRVALNNGVRMVGGAAQGSASAVWGAVLSREGQLIYNLFSRQLSVFVPTFKPSQQIQGDIFMQRSFWLRNLSVDPCAVSVLLALAPPGLNFTSFWVSDVKVSWKNLLELAECPIVVDIQSLRATAAEQPVGTDEEVEDTITQWLSISGGDQAFPFEGRYPLLDGATFRVRSVQLNITSPTRYGDVMLNVRGLEVRSVDIQGKQRDLKTLCELGLSGGNTTQDDEEEEAPGVEKLITFSRLYECSQASARYTSQDRSFEGLDIKVSDGADTSQPKEQFLLAPTPFAAQLTQTKIVADMRRSVTSRWKISFPGMTSLLTLPPILSPAPTPPPLDPRLFPFEAPPTEWQISFANGDPFDWIFSSWRMQPTKTKYAAAAGMGVGFVIAALCVALLAAAALRPRRWFSALLAKGPSLIAFLYSKLPSM